MPDYTRAVDDHLLTRAQAGQHLDLATEGVAGPPQEDWGSRDEMLRACYRDRRELDMWNVVGVDGVSPQQAITTSGSPSWSLLARSARALFGSW